MTSAQDVTIRSFIEASSTGLRLFCLSDTVLILRKGYTVAKPKRNLVKDVASHLRGLAEDLDRLLNPPPPLKPARVLVPIPVRPQRQKNDIYR